MKTKIAFLIFLLISGCVFASSIPRLANEKEMVQIIEDQAKWKDDCQHFPLAW